MRRHALAGLGQAGLGTVLGFLKCQREAAGWPVSAPAALSPGLIIVNAWYGKFVNDKSRKRERVKVIDVTVPLQCLVKDSKLILTEASKVQHQVTLVTRPQGPAPCDKDSQASAWIAAVQGPQSCQVPANTWPSLPGACVSCLLGSRKRLQAQQSPMAMSGRLQAALRKGLGTSRGLPK